MHIYLARPIDQTDPDRRVPGTLFTVNQDILTAIGQQGHSAFQPSRAYQLPKPPWTEADMQHVDAINRFAMWEADGVIAILLPGIATLGTVAEVEQALAADTPVCIVTTEALRQRSVQLAGWAARGANIVFCSEEGRIHGLDIKTALTPVVEQIRELRDVTGFNEIVPTYVEGREVQPSDLQVIYMDPAAKPLQRAHPTDAGLDLATLETIELHHGQRTLIRTGVQAPPPEGWWGLIKARSSTQQSGIQVNEAVIDAGYQGELMISVTLVHTGRSRLAIDAGSRLAQYILIPTFPGRVVPVHRFAESARGEKGWGSSGS